MKVEYFPTKNWYISKRNMELFEDRVQPCHWKVFKCQALGWLRTLYTGLARNIKFEIFRLPGSAWGLQIKLEHFRIKYSLDFEEKYGKISDCRTFNYFKFSHFIAGTSATLTVCVTILICYFAWTTTSTTLSSASSSPRTGNFNWPLVLFNKDGTLQLKKIDEWMKTCWINLLRNARKDFRVLL